MTSMKLSLILILNALYITNFNSQIPVQLSYFNPTQKVKAFYVIKFVGLS